MPSNDYPVLDGIAPSWADLAVTITGYTGGLTIETKDIAALNSGVTVEIGEQRGTGGQLRRRTRGQATYEGSITFYRDGYEKWLEMIQEIAPVQGGESLISLVHFDVLVQHILPEVSGITKVFEYKILGARGAGRTANHAEGVDADQVEVPLSVAKVVEMIKGKPMRWI